MSFRQINEIEKEIMITSLSKISSEFSQIIENYRTFLYISIERAVSKNKFPNIFLISKDQVRLLHSLNNNKIISAGLYFGFIKKGNFYLSLEGAEFLYKQDIFSDFKRLYINEKGEKSILYGNNILKKMVIKPPSNLQKQDFLLVFNEIDEIIAIAQSKVENIKFKQLKSNEIIAVNLSDKGLYLRKKQ
ncbi:MAG: NIP7 N-terminal domain-related protein [Promethearchaeota archaeon]